MGFLENNNSKLVWQLGLGVLITVAIISLAFFIFSNVDLSNSLPRVDKYSVNSVDMSDKDNDGLAAVDEDFYGTDPTASDSDADGFSDSEEIFNDFNPLGEGAISGTYRTTLIEKADSKFSLINTKTKRDFIDTLSGYKLELGPGWAYAGKLYEGEHSFVYEIAGKRMVTLSVLKGAAPATILGLLTGSTDNKTKAELNSLELLFDVYCHFYSQELIKSLPYDINGEDGWKYIKDNKECYVARAQNVYDGGKGETNLIIYVNYYINSPESEQAVAELIKSYDDIKPDIVKLSEYSSLKHDATLSFCSRVVNAHYRDNCFYDLAVRTAVKEYCSLVAAQEKRTLCLSVATNPIIGCGKGYKGENCLNDVAVARRDVDICQKIDNYSQKNECIMAVAYAKGSVETCEILPNEKISNYRNKCLAQVAVSQGRSGIITCRLIDDNYRRASCVEAIAAEVNDIKFCRELQDEGNQTYQSNCYLKLAIKNKELNICSNIKNAKIKQQCISIINDPEEYLNNLAESLQ